MSEKEHQFDLSEIPQPIKVLYRTYRLEWMEHWDSSQGNKIGIHDLCKGVIALCPWLDKQEAANTLIHELIHAVWQLLAMSKKMNQEDVAACLASGLSAILVDNSGLFEWIEKALRAKPNEAKETQCTPTNTESQS